MQCFNGTASMLWLLCTCVSLSVLLSRPIYLKMFCVPPSPSSPPRLSLAVCIARRRWRAKEVRGHTCSNIGSNSIWCVPCCSASLRHCPARLKEHHTLGKMKTHLIHSGQCRRLLGHFLFELMNPCCLLSKAKSHWPPAVLGEELHHDLVLGESIYLALLERIGHPTPLPAETDHMRPTCFMNFVL